MIRNDCETPAEKVVMETLDALYKTRHSLSMLLLLASTGVTALLANTARPSSWTIAAPNPFEDASTSTLT